MLLRSVAQRKGYDQDAFLADFVTFMTTPGANKDPYTEVYLRRWFENYAAGLPPHACAAQQRAIWSIGSHGGLLRPLVVSLLSDSAFQAVGVALEHQACTHRSELVASALTVAVPLLNELVRGAPAAEGFARAARSVRTPKIEGRELLGLYRAHRGPNNIPAEQMWRLHNELRTEPFDLVETAKKPTAEVARAVLGTACYTEHGVPLAMFLAAKSGFDLRTSLLASVNVGGDNVHRSAFLGLLLGAAAAEIPEDLQRGLRDYEAIRQEIEAFVAVAVGSA